MSEEEKAVTTPQDFLLEQRFPDIKRMKLKDLRTEVTMWRRIWSWIPSEVRYFVARTGTLMAYTGRDYKRHLGILQQTYWDIKEIELGVSEKVYDTVTGKYFLENKIIRTKLGGVIDIQWIATREDIEKLEGEAEQLEVPEEAQELDMSDV